MTVFLYSLFDRITHTHGNFFFSPNNEDAKRRCFHANKDNPFSADLELHRLANINLESGNVAPCTCDTFVCHLVDGGENV